MSHSIIKENIYEIILTDKIENLKEEDLINLFCTIQAFKTLEIKKGNEFEKIFIKMKYMDSMLVTEYLNIFNLIRKATFYEFIKYFINFKKRVETQGPDTKLNINEYLNKIENVSQSVFIKMIFNIDTSIEELEKEKKKYYRLLTVGNIHQEIIKSVKDEK